MCMYAHMHVCACIHIYTHAHTCLHTAEFPEPLAGWGEEGMFSDLIPSSLLSAQEQNEPGQRSETLRPALSVGSAGIFTDGGGESQI